MIEKKLTKEQLDAYPAFQAIRNSDFWKFYNLLNNMPNILVRNIADRTLLHESMGCGEGAITIILLERGIPPRIKTNEGRTPYSCGDSAGHHGLKHLLFLFSEHKEEYYSKVRSEIKDMSKSFSSTKRKMAKVLLLELKMGEERRAKEAEQKQLLRK